MKDTPSRRSSFGTSLVATLAVIFLVVWISGLVVVHYYAKIFVAPPLKVLNSGLPQPFAMPLQAGTPVRLFDVAFTLPVPAERAYPLLLDHQLSGVVLKPPSTQTENRELLAIEVYPDNIESLPFSPRFRGLTRLMLGNDLRSSTLFRTLHYATPDDFSLWNLPHNVRLAYLLTLKGVLWPSYFSAARVYVLPPAGLEGFLIEGGRKAGDDEFSEIQAWQGERFYRIVRRSSTGNANLHAIAASLQPASETTSWVAVSNASVDFNSLAQMSCTGLNAEGLEQVLEVHRQRDAVAAARLTSLAAEIEYRKKLESQGADLRQ